MIFVPIQKIEWFMFPKMFCYAVGHLVISSVSAVEFSASPPEKGQIIGPSQTAMWLPRLGWWYRWTVGIIIILKTWTAEFFVFHNSENKREDAKSCSCFVHNPIISQGFFVFVPMAYSCTSKCYNVLFWWPLPPGSLLSWKTMVIPRLVTVMVSGTQLTLNNDRPRHKIRNQFSTFQWRGMPLSIARRHGAAPGHEILMTLVYVCPMISQFSTVSPININKPGIWPAWALMSPST